MKIKGIAYWPSVYQPNTTFTPKYCIDLIVDKEGKEQIEAEGIKVVADEDRGGFLVKFSLNAFRKDGSAANKPEVVDSANEPTDVQFGNGSEVVVMYHPYEWAYVGKSGVKGILDGVQILKLVEYVGRDSFDVVMEDEVGEDTSISTQDISSAL